MEKLRKRGIETKTRQREREKKKTSSHLRGRYLLLISEKILERKKILNTDINRIVWQLVKCWKHKSVKKYLAHQSFHFLFYFSTFISSSSLLCSFVVVSIPLFLFFCLHVLPPVLSSPAYDYHLPLYEITEINILQISIPLHHFKLSRWTTFLFFVTFLPFLPSLFSTYIPPNIFFVHAFIRYFTLLSISYFLLFFLSLFTSFLSFLLCFFFSVLFFSFLFFSFQFFSAFLTVFLTIFSNNFLDD